MNQRDIGGLYDLPSLTEARFVDTKIIDSFSSFRDAVIWSWKERKGGKGQTDAKAQSYFCLHFDYTPSHFSRAVNPNTKSPMDLKTDSISAFESFTGNRAVTQYLNRLTSTTSLEEIQAARMSA